MGSTVDKKRNEKIAEERELNTELDPEIYEALMKSTSLSSKFINILIWSVFLIFGYVFNLF